MDAPQRIGFVGASPEIALRIEAQAISPPAWLHESGNVAIGAPFENAIVRLVGEEHVADGIACGPFGELVGCVYFLQGGAWRNDFTLAREHAVSCHEKGSEDQGQLEEELG